jgi:peptide/nickel transport system permease protein
MIVVWAAVFSFMGLSGSDALADWGQMLSFSRDWIIGTPLHPFRFWFTYIPPSVAIVLFSIGWNLVGDGLREVLDPRQSTVTHA